jgi:lipopolysaccharide export system ATP-binding protein
MFILQYHPVLGLDNRMALRENGQVGGIEDNFFFFTASYRDQFPWNGVIGRLNPIHRLEIQKLFKTYGKRRVVNEVSLSLAHGEIVGLLGPNGAGKTTTFNMVVGIVKPDSGTIMLGGKNISRLPLYKRARAGLGYLAQEKSIFNKLTVEQNLMAILETTRLSRAEQKIRMEQLLEELGVAHLRKNPGGKLSGGETRRVEIARALIIEPQFLLLDEPFAGIDPKTVEELQDIIRHLKNRGLGILITDHNVRETLTVTDRAYIIHKGTILHHGSAEVLIHDPEVRRHYLGERFYMHTGTETP